MKTSSAGKPLSGGASPGGKPLLILVEDDLDDSALFLRALQKAGVTCPVICVEEGLKALDALTRLGPEVTGVCLVSVSQLPDISGLELLRSVRQMVLPVPVKFAFLTG